jgi:hypothetical protein
MTKFDICICQATEALEAGFTTEAARKRALGNVIIAAAQELERRAESA